MLYSIACISRCWITVSSRTNAIQFSEKINLTGNSKQDFIAAATWGFADNNADHTMLIVSNHGWGILDPHWNESTAKWAVESDTVKRSRIIEHQKNHRGFMFNHQSHTYLTNNDLIDGLWYIKTQLLQNQNLDIIAFDTCMGAMVEVAYQIAPYVSFMLGCQSCALTDGFEYTSIMKSLKSEYNTPRDVAISMVNIFDTYYNIHDLRGIYTNSAFDLSVLQDVCFAMDRVVSTLLNMSDATDILAHAQKDTPRLCMWPMYTDMIQFFISCSQYIQNNTDFNEALTELLEKHSRLVINYCAGFDVRDFVHGSGSYTPPIKRVA